jgi:serine phosphatase RsbU (regulator of sigma subunit)
MEPASEVGGDYYDVIAVDGGGWIGIGDVAGHGLSSGLVMLMAQTSVATLVEALPEASPRGLLMSVNRVVYENVNRRLRRHRHMTMSLIRYYAEGRMVIAGAHLDVIVVRAATGRAEEIPTSGTWLGLVEDIASVTSETTLDLADGDTVVVYTDGVTEAEDERGEMFGGDRLREVIESHAGQPAQAIVDAIFGAVGSWQSSRQDDESVVVMRYHAVS